MPIDIAIHALGNPIAGQLMPAPIVPPLAGQQALAEGVDSNEFVLDKAAVVFVTPSVKIRLDIQRSDGISPPTLNPAASFIVLDAGQVGSFTLERGKWKLKSAAY